MSRQFSVNLSRFDPYKSFRFQIYFDTSTTPVAGMSKVTPLKRSSDPIEYKEGGNPIILKGLAERVDARDELERIDRAYAQKYVAPDSGETATIFIEGDFVFRVRPQRVLAWSYANVSLRTDWEFEQA